MLTSDSFFSLQTQHDQSPGNTDTTNKQDKERTGKDKVFPLSVWTYVKLSDTAASCSLNELLTPLPWADVSTGKLDSRFPVNKPQVLQIKVCWNNSSCYKSTNSLFTSWIQKDRNTSKKFSKQTGSHPNVNNQLTNVVRQLLKNEVIHTRYLYNLLLNTKPSQNTAFHFQISFPHRDSISQLQTSM